MKITRVFSSFEEADQADALADSRLTPQKCLRIVDELRERTHPDGERESGAVLRLRRRLRSVALDGALGVSGGRDGFVTMNECLSS